MLRAAVVLQILLKGSHTHIHTHIDLIATHRLRRRAILPDASSCSLCSSSTVEVCLLIFVLVD